MLLRRRRVQDALKELWTTRAVPTSEIMAFLKRLQLVLCHSPMNCPVCHRMTCLFIRCFVCDSRSRTRHLCIDCMRTRSPQYVSDRLVAVVVPVTLRMRTLVTAHALVPWLCLQLKQSTPILQAISRREVLAYRMQTIKSAVEVCPSSCCTACVRGIASHPLISRHLASRVLHRTLAVSLPASARHKWTSINEITPRHWRSTTASHKPCASS